MCTWDAENERWVTCLQGGPANHRRRDERSVLFAPVEFNVKSIENEGMDALARIADRLREIWGGPDTTYNSDETRDAVRQTIDAAEEMISQAADKIDSTINALKSLAIAEEMKRAATSVKTDPAPPVVNDLGQWWMNLAEGEFGAIAAKMREYGGQGNAIDLIDIGKDLAEIADQEIASNGDAMELGIYFYLRGKFARWKAAVMEGRPVSDDTLHDIGVYVRMAQRIRAVGGWPS